MIKKINIIILCFIIFFSLFTTSSDCVSTNKLKDIFNNSSTIDSEDQQSIDEIEETATNLLGAIIRGVQVCGVGIAIIMAISLGIKYVVASIEERAEIKKHLVVFVLGAFIFFSASEIIKILQDFIFKNTKTS